MNPISNTDVFEADTRYQVAIYLDNKGLNTAPAVTVNGKTPEFCGIATRNGVPFQLQITYTLGTPPMPPLTIDGPDVVCAQQDYEFSVTTADGAKFDDDFSYDLGWSYVGLLTRTKTASDTALCRPRNMVAQTASSWLYSERRRTERP